MTTSKTMTMSMLTMTTIIRDAMMMTTTSDGNNYYNTNHYGGGIVTSVAPISGSRTVAHFDPSVGGERVTVRALAAEDSWVLVTGVRGKAAR
ncbi:hypothetical protein ALC53_07699 [Atta colombica]|uniref:Uncharacterized protein n=1 Tax=Atta colombica TaxID=520822 RepID=A0A195BCF9_9HYME|nr:hypothetical protein ALC53_07699 [Atta colombica]